MDTLGGAADLFSIIDWTQDLVNSGDYAKQCFSMLVVAVIITVYILIKEVGFILNIKKNVEAANKAFIKKFQLLAYADNTWLMWGLFSVQALFIWILFFAMIAILTLPIWDLIKIISAILFPIFAHLILILGSNQIYALSHAREVREYNIERTKPSHEKNIYLGISILYIILYGITNAICVLGIKDLFGSIEVASLAVMLFIIITGIIFIILFLMAMLIKPNTDLYKKILKKEGLFR